MHAHEIASNIWAIHADITTDTRFEGIWPIPHGVTLNSYLVKGDKTALIDLAKDWAGSISQFETQLAEAGSRFEDIDYLVLNHLEPDHTAYITEIRRRNPDVQIISTPKGIAMVEKFFKITDNLRSVKTGDTLDLGGPVLEFFETPNIHWPETMMSFDRVNGILFSCDGFGSYGTLGERVFDDQFTTQEHAFYEAESLRYYSNIVASFSTFVTKALAQLAGLPVKVVAPSHGIIWRTNPAEIINRYARYAGYNTGTTPCEKEICVIWGSMYGYTKQGVDAVLEGIVSEGVPCTTHQIPDTDASFVLADAYKAAGLVLAMPTYEYKMFPPMAHVLDLFQRKHFTGKKALRLGSWGWVGGAKKEYEEKIEGLKWDSIEPVEWQGLPSPEDLALLRERGAQLARLVKGS